jgi:hypothetical protein
MVVLEVYQQVFMDGLTENPLEAHICERIDEPAHNTMF